MTWSEIVLGRLLPNNLVIILKSVDSICHPLSVVIIDGAPNTITNLETNAFVMVCAAISGSGIVSSNLVKWSLHVSRCVIARWKRTDYIIVHMLKVGISR